MRLMSLLSRLRSSGCPRRPPREWIEFASTQDSVHAQFPRPAEGRGKPPTPPSTVPSFRRTSTTSRTPKPLFVTVVDYHPLERMLTAKSEACRRARKLQRHVGDEAGAGMEDDLRGALVYATMAVHATRPKVTHYLWAFVDLVEGHRLQMTTTPTNPAPSPRSTCTEQALHPRGHRPAGNARARAVSTILGLARRERRSGFAIRCLQQRDIYLNGHPPPERLDRTARNSQSVKVGSTRRVRESLYDAWISALGGLCAVALVWPARLITRTATTSRSSSISRNGHGRAAHQPHSWIYMDVKGKNGEATSMGLEATGTGGLARSASRAATSKTGRHDQGAPAHPARRRLGRLSARVHAGRRWSIRLGGGQALPVDDGFFDLKK